MVKFAKESRLGRSTIISRQLDGWLVGWLVKNIKHELL
jgi:hypothetical protein